MVELRRVKSFTRLTEMLEVWQEGEFIAAIYPTDAGVKIISKYFTQETGPILEVDTRDPIAISIVIRKPPSSSGEPSTSRAS